MKEKANDNEYQFMEADVGESSLKRINSLEPWQKTVMGLKD